MPGDIYYNVHATENGKTITIIRDMAFQTDAVKAARKAAREYGSAWIDEYTPKYGLVTVYEIDVDKIRHHTTIESGFTYTPKFERKLAKELMALDKRLGRPADLSLRRD